MAPIVSIIIRAYNESLLLGQVLEALRGQTLPVSEVILVDSGSTDDTVAIARANGAKVIPFKGEFSYGGALNLGFAAAKGQVLITLSGHAVPADQYWLAHLLEPLRERRVAAASSRLVAYPRRSSWHNYLLHWPYYWVWGPWKNHLSVFWNTAAAYKADVWRLFPFSESLPGCEDREWGMRVITAGYEIAYQPRSVVWHYHNESFLQYARRSYRQMSGHVSLSLSPRLPRRPSPERSEES